MGNRGEKCTPQKNNRKAAEAERERGEGCDPFSIAHSLMVRPPPADQGPVQEESLHLLLLHF